MELKYSTSKRIEIIDITRDVEKVVAKAGVKEGLCVITVPHATAALILQEAEAGLLKDIEDKIKELFYEGEEKYRHNRIDDNAAAHIASAFLGTTKVLPIVDGRILRGVWQNILLVELDGPRAERRVIVKILEG